MKKVDRSTAQATRPMDRRDFLWQAGGGLAGVALTSLLDQDGLLASPDRDAEPKPFPNRPAKAKSVIQIFCPGAVSHLDTYDYKPELDKRDGKPFDNSGKVQFFASKPGNLQKSYFRFSQHGESGRWLSSLFPRLAECVDDMAFVYSMHNKSALHGPATFMINTGFTLPGFPSMGSWITYGLGNENRDLPSFVVLPDSRGVPPGGPANWGCGFLPARVQGTAIEVTAGQPPIADLYPPQQKGITPGGEREMKSFLRQLNAQHLQQRIQRSDLEARIDAYELSARLQLSAPEVTDLSHETRQTQTAYGLDVPEWEPFGRQCLMARRLVERGVRFVQVFCGADNIAPPRPNWDAHEDLKANHGRHGPLLDCGAAALIQDLKQRGLLEETLVLCTTEFGRQPAAQGKGRDHNPGAFTAWMAGGGIRGGVAFGATDELGFKAVEKPTYSYDLHATVLHLLGIDHTRLTYYHNGIRRRLTDVHGQVIRELLS
ncbi:MAG: DUF1501 domain-containing protein [Planctomycetota bacterium]|nr:DUF1501 domain-containing protein [Planctomycetota bacterium]